MLPLLQHQHMCSASTMAFLTNSFFLYASISNYLFSCDIHAAARLECLCQYSQSYDQKGRRVVERSQLHNLLVSSHSSGQGVFIRTKAPTGKVARLHFRSRGGSGFRNPDIDLLLDVLQGLPNCAYSNLASPLARFHRKLAPGKQRHINSHQYVRPPE